MRLVVGAVLVAILAGSAHAQSASPAPGGTSAPPTSPAIADGAPTPAGAPPFATAPVPPPPPDRPHAATNPVVEFLVGGAAGAAGLFVGAYAGYELHCAVGCRGDFAGLEGLLLGGALGLTTGAAAGVAATGSDREHKGSFAWAWLGAAAGATGAAYATRRFNSESAVALMIAGAALGGTVAFDLTRTRRPSTAVRLVPLISGGGVQLALVGAR
ncbi:MAG TPA: hypothetical protein VHT91_20660 [Kofleriaceae bacterium]|nr:hypothetical protein [Kofleriaceae bacterium]